MSSSIHANNVVDLAGSPSPLKQITSPSNDRKRAGAASLRKKRRSPRPRGNNASDGGVMQNNNGVGGCSEIIDLAADTPPSSVSPGMAMRSGRKKRAGRKRPRPWRHSTGLEIDVDDDIVEVEIISSPKAAAAAARGSLSTAAAYSSRTQKQQSSHAMVNQIRNVFPLLSRAKAESFLDMARTYSTEEDDNTIYFTIMGVLSEDPLGTSVSEATFAALAVGGRRKGGNATIDLASATSRSGKRKVAQLECQCCFSETDFEDMVSCRTGGHLFCKTCLQKHVEQRVFGNGNLGVQHNGANAKSSSKALEILCMADCTSGFDDRQLRAALSDKVLTKYNELQYAAVIESANMKDIGRCPKCHFVAVTDPMAPPLLFHCPKCNFKSCRECGEEYHPKIRCDQVETKGETNGRKVVEEAMTSAMVRTCPRPMCRKKFLKTDGCNKMTCSCGCFVCYVCRKEIPANVGYTHFCQTPHCNHKSCNKCPLYADTKELDEARIRNEAQRAAKSVSNQVNADVVDSLLKDPPATWGRKR